MANLLLCLIFLFSLANLAFIDANSTPDFNPPVFSKQPADITSDQTYKKWVGARSFKGGIPRFQAAENMKDNCDFQFILSCVAANAKTYTWYRNGAEFDPRAADSSWMFVNESVDGSLVVKRWKISDEGTYQCAAANEAGQVFSSSFYIGSVEVSPKYESVPTPETSAVPNQHSMNMDYILDCFEATRKYCGHPVSCVKPYKLQVEFAPAVINSKIDWNEYSTTVVGDYAFLDEESGKFHFFSYPTPAAGDSGTPIDGMYRCKIHPDGDMRNIKFINEKYLKFIGSPATSDPSLIYPPAAKGKTIHLVEGTVGEQLQCVFKGFPPPQVSYLPDSDLPGLVRLGRYSLSVVTRAMNNKRLTCTGKPASGVTGAQRDETFTISVEFPPNTTMYSPLLPFVRDSALSVQMICEVSPSNPKPMVSFNFNGRLISDSRKRFEKESEGIYRLSISNPNPSDAGIYVCNATNSRGSSFSSRRLVFIEPTRVVLYYWDETQTEINKTIAPETIYKTNGSLYIKCEIKNLDPQNYLVTSNNQRNINVRL